MLKSLRSRFRCCLALLAAGLSLAAPLAAQAADAPSAAQVQVSIARQARGEFRNFYAYRASPLWIARDGTFDPGAKALLRLVQTAEYDGLRPDELGGAELATAISEAERRKSPANLARAELALSNALVAYIDAMLSQASGSEMIYEHDVLRPIRPTALTILRAAEAGSMEGYVTEMQWMHPMYAQVRRQLIAGEPGAPVRQAALASLERIAAIPSPPWSRHVVIDAASARLWMYEGGRVVDSMRVVVGKPDTQTPIMSGYIRHAVLKPYWNVPAHLVRRTIAPGVLSQGVSYLRTRGYEVLSDWSDTPKRLNPARIDWRAVRDGTLEVRVRQAPGAANAMGQVKYEFPNALGIYLHDTPDKDLMLEDARQFSNGCVRLEDAERLGRWLLEGALPEVDEPEERVDLRQPVPVYITYVTVHAEGGQLALGPDPYGRDGGPALAQLQ